MKNDPAWKENFPVSQPDEHRISRREMTKFACLGLATCAGAAAVRPILLPSPPDAPPVQVATTKELSPGDSKLFHYPTENHPAILIRRMNGSYAAYSQSCTHLMCPIHFDSAANQLVCPCHAGFFDAADGSVVAGPPPKPLPSYPVSIQNEHIVVG